MEPQLSRTGAMWHGTKLRTPRCQCTTRFQAMHCPQSRFAKHLAKRYSMQRNAPHNSVACAAQHARATKSMRAVHKLSALRRTSALAWLLAPAVPLDANAPPVPCCCAAIKWG